MITFVSNNYLSGNLNADIVGAWIHCAAIEYLVAQVELTIITSGNGASVVFIDGTNDPSHEIWKQIGSFGPSDSIGVPLPFDNVAITGTSTATLPLPEWVRLAWRHDASDPVQGTLRVRLIGRA